MAPTEDGHRTCQPLLSGLVDWALVVRQVLQQLDRCFLDSEHPTRKPEHSRPVGIHILLLFLSFIPSAQISARETFCSGVSCYTRRPRQPRPVGPPVR